MSRLKVLTFSDKPLPSTNYLKKSCEDKNLELEVIIHSPWTFNAIKVKLIHEYLAKADQDLLLLVVDALDVVIYDDEGTIIKKFNEINGDIVFSAESNFYFRNRKLAKKYWKEYPKSNTIYDYLNSGTYMGKVADLKLMLEQLITENNVSLSEDSLRRIRSDQYMFSKHYVDKYRTKESPTIRLDHEQSLMGCSGGRFSVIPFPDLTKAQSFWFFILERTLLKMLNLHRFQNRSKDFIFIDERVFQKKTKTQPGVLHLPGTWDRFLSILKNMRKKNKSFKLLWVLAAMVSLLSYVISIILIPLQIVLRLLKLL